MNPGETPDTSTQVETLRERAEAFDQWLREGGNHDVADLVGSLSNLVETLQQENATLLAAKLASERLRAEDAASYLDEQNRLRAEIARLW